MKLVTDGLRAAIARGAFEDELGARVRQLGANMVDGREFAPIADKPLDVPELLRFALRCMRDADASWDDWFGVRA